MGDDRSRLIYIRILVKDEGVRLSVSSPVTIMKNH